MLYRINEVSKITGLSSSGIRYYEDQGVVTPTRNESGYRFYTMSDISAIQRAINYRQMGFSLMDSANLAKESKYTTIIDSLSKRQCEQEVYVEEQKEILKTIENRIEQINVGINMLFLCSIVNSPEMYWLNIYTWYKKELKPISNEILNLSVCLGPGASPTIRIQVSELLGNEDYIFSDVGNSVLAEEWAEDEFNENEMQHFTFFPSQKCIYTVLKFENNGPFMRRHIEHVLNFASENNLTFCGPAFSRRIIALKDELDVETYIYSQFWFPIK